jgi:hypothetical protein
MTMTRGALTSIVFSKILTVAATVAATKGSNTLTLITTNVENIGKSPRHTHLGSYRVLISGLLS